MSRSVWDKIASPAYQRELQAFKARSFANNRAQQAEGQRKEAARAAAATRHAARRVLELAGPTPYRGADPRERLRNTAARVAARQQLLAEWRRKRT
jgi:hypothetical protein